MKQEIVAKVGGKVSKLLLPSAKEEVLQGVCWGDCAFIFTPAYWKTLAWMMGDAKPRHHRLGDNLTEEIAACLLGGYGIPSEVGLAAFDQIKRCGILDGNYYTSDEIYEILSKPLICGSKSIRYRFAKQKSNYLSKALKKLCDSDAPIDDHRKFRHWLLEFEGIGYKTASWITRNWLHSDEVAIIDIHIHRAGILIGLYSATDSPSKNYLNMEEKFLAFAQIISVKASQLDALIWREMKNSGSMALRSLKNAVEV